jgi:hypothetical protein
MNEIDLKIFETFVFPHVRYLASDNNSNPSYVYKRYIGDSPSLTKDKVYRFHKAKFSPDRETPYKEYWVTKSDDDGPYVRFEDTRKQWVKTKQ